jgi:hypothetical protein
MKTLLFGLATVAACATAPSQPEVQYPLCDRQGAPACGNIGQVGRAQRAPVITEDANAVFASGAARPPATTAAPTVTPKPTRVLIGASREMTSGASAVQRPLTDEREQMACGNVMTKGGSYRQCTKVSAFNGTNPEDYFDGPVTYKPAD